RPVIVGGGVVLAASYEAKAFGVYTPMGATQARRLCPQAIVVRPRMEAYSAASEAMFEVFRDTTAFRGGAVDRRGVLGRRRAPSDLRHPDPDRGASAPGAARTGRPPGHGGRGADEVPGESGQRRRETRWPARGSGRRRARVPARAPGRAAVGRRTGDGAEAPRALDHHGGGGGWARRAGAGADPRARIGTSPLRPRAQP